MLSRSLAMFVVASGVCLSAVADAHVGISSGPAQAAKSQLIKFSVGHGCEGLDTLRVKVTIPAGVTSVRALRSDFGPPKLQKTGDVVTSVTWQKPEADLLADDSGYYELAIRARIPDAPFTQLAFVIEQTCRRGDGTEETVLWNEGPGGTGNPAPLLTIVPSHTNGWNKVVLGGTTTLTTADLPTYFGDAQIVWRGTAAYSSNASTASMITTTPGVTALTGLAPSDEVWVKY